MLETEGLKLATGFKPGLASLTHFWVWSVPVDMGEQGHDAILV